MSAEVVQSRNKIMTTYRGITEVKGEIEMRVAKEITEIKARGLQELLTWRSAKLIGGLALGALLMTATALPLGPINADGPGRVLVSEEIVIDRGDDHIPGDEWMYDSPFYETFLEAGSAADLNR